MRINLPETGFHFLIYLVSKGERKGREGENPSSLTNQEVLKNKTKQNGRERKNVELLLSVVALAPVQTRVRKVRSSRQAKVLVSESALSRFKVILEDLEQLYHYRSYILWF